MRNSVLQIHYEIKYTFSKYRFKKTIEHKITKWKLLRLDWNFKLDFESSISHVTYAETQDTIVLFICYPLIIIYLLAVILDAGEYC